nr:MAG TPA: hypothetical protein [Caudoviricetes sp.]
MSVNLIDPAGVKVNVSDEDAAHLLRQGYKKPPVKRPAGKATAKK